MPRLMPTPARCRLCRHSELYSLSRRRLPRIAALARFLPLMLRHPDGRWCTGSRFNIGWLCEMFVPKISGVFVNNIPVLRILAAICGTAYEKNLANFAVTRSTKPAPYSLEKGIATTALMHSGRKSFWPRTNSYRAPPIGGSPDGPTRPPMTCESAQQREVNANPGRGRRVSGSSR